MVITAWLVTIGQKVSMYMGALLAKRVEARMNRKVKLKMTGLEGSYHYSFYDVRENHVKEGGKKAINQVFVSGVITNERDKTTTITNIYLAVCVGEQRTALTVVDMKARERRSYWIIPAGASMPFEWKGIIKAHDKAPFHTGLINVDPTVQEITLEITYLDEFKRNHKHPILVPEARMLDATLIVG